MSKRRSLDERIEEKLKKEQEHLKKSKEYSAQAKKLEQQKKEEERKIRTHRLIEIGGAVESVLGRPFGDGDIDRLLDFLYCQERDGSFFTRAMNPAQESLTEDSGVAGGVTRP